MRWISRRLPALLLALLALPCSRSAAAAYVPTNRDTRFFQERMQIQAADLGAYTLLHRTQTCDYLFREDRDVIAVVDRRSGYTWKTGLDAGFPDDIRKAVKAAGTPEEK